MIKKSIIFLNVFIVSACIICFEIVTTRISSVIFVNNYAYFILSLAILGLGMGGIFSYYRIKDADISLVISKALVFLGASFLLFLVPVILLKITNPLIYFVLLFFPFFFGGIFYAQIFKFFAKKSFLVYSFDLIGAATGSVAAIFSIDYLGASNSVLLLVALVFFAVLTWQNKLGKKTKSGLYTVLALLVIALAVIGETPLLGRIPIGNYAEKDFYHVYPNAAKISRIIDSRWSIHGRADLVQYHNQDMVKQLFVDGAAGTQMFRFNGEKRNPGNMLANLLSNYSTAIPIMLLQPHEKNSMLVIGPGGGKEVLTGLLSGVDQITGVEINPDFVNIVKTHSSFNGGIYTDFPNVRIHVKEGRHFIKQADQKFDVLVMALPSTEQLQNIDNMAMSENYLLTKEALADYINILTPEGRLIITVHNRWELMRLLVTSIYAFKDMYISPQQALDHFLLLADDYSPTIVIKKKAFTKEEIAHVKQATKQLPQQLPSITFLPFHWQGLQRTPENTLLETIKAGRVSLEKYINQDQYDISPVLDDSPYFYKITKGIPDDMKILLFIVILINALLIVVPVLFIKKKTRPLVSSIVFFGSLGTGFMLLEVSIFQKLILYLGSPTMALSLLLCSLLVSMGVGSFAGERICSQNIKKRIQTISVLILVVGTLFFFLSQFVLSLLLQYELIVRAIVTVLLIFPFGFLLGILFPTCIQYLENLKLTQYIPWMYGINGTMSVLGSILAVVLSMLLGFTPAFFIGILCYFLVFVASFYLTAS